MRATLRTVGSVTSLIVSLASVVRPLITLQVSVEASPVALRREGLSFGDVAAGLLEVGLEGRGEVGIGGFLDHFGKSVGDLLLHVESFLEAGDVKGA